MISSIQKNPEVRYATLEQLISQRLLDDQARRDQLRSTAGPSVSTRFPPSDRWKILAERFRVPGVRSPKSSPEFVNDVRRP
jgi:hypothetical protein